MDGEKQIKIEGQRAREKLTDGRSTCDNAVLQAGTRNRSGEVKKQKFTSAEHKQKEL